MSRESQTRKILAEQFSIVAMNKCMFGCRNVAVLCACFLLAVIPAVADPDHQGAALSPGAQAEILGVYFTPPTGAATAIEQALDQSEREVLVQAYGFTHNAIAQALVRAHQRGVVVRVLLDDKSSTTNRYVIDMLMQANVALRLDGKHAIAHNKVMVIDESVIITGSFNFTNSAATRNAENFLVLKSHALALRYKSEWKNHWGHGRELSQ
jgi:phosphatidylserine/phosphatidylglycerophosphate/cardiolipin synthase-like enzyme